MESTEPNRVIELLCNVTNLENKKFYMSDRAK